MAAFFEDDMKPGMMHDNMNAYTIKFWHTKDDGYRTKETLTLYIEDETSEDKVLKLLTKKYKDPDIIVVKYQ